MSRGWRSTSCTASKTAESGQSGSNWPTAWTSRRNWRSGSSSPARNPSWRALSAAPTLSSKASTDPAHWRILGETQEDGPMTHIRRFDHVGITVADLDRATAFFVGLGLEVEGRMLMEGEFVDTVIGIPHSRSEIVMLRPPDGGAGVELSSFIQPAPQPGSPTAMSTELGLRNVSFEVDNLQAAVDGLAAD